MFDKAIVDTDRFMDLSMSSKALYFLLGMEADDEGFVSYKKVMRIHGGNDDDIKSLLMKNFIIGFKSGVVVITDWKKNNWLDTRRIKPTEYQVEKQLLAINKDKSYVLSEGLASIEESSIEESSIEEKNPISKSKNFDRFWEVYPKKENKKKSRGLWESKKMDGHINEILEFVEKAKKTDRWIDGYVKAPDVFLRNETWEDDLSSYNNINKEVGHEVIKI